MADNVVKFRKIEKKPDPKAPQKPRPPGEPPNYPVWLPWAVLVVLAIGLAVFQNPAAFGL
jgi:hypothetical protein